MVRRSLPWRGTGLWTVPAAMLVVFALLLSVPEDSPPVVGADSVSVPYEETVVSPEVSRVYSVTSTIESDSWEIELDNSKSWHPTASRNAEAVTATQDELGVTRFELDSSSRATAWHNGDVFYAHSSRWHGSIPLDITMIDASENSVTTWQTPLNSIVYSGLVDSSGSYYAMTHDGKFFRLDPVTGHFTTWNEKRLIDTTNSPYLFADDSDNLYFVSPSGSRSGSLNGDVITTTMPFVTLSSRTESDKLGAELITIVVSVGATGAYYGTLETPDGDRHLLSDSYNDYQSITRVSTAGVLGEYTANVQNRLGTTTVTLTLTEEQKISTASSPSPTATDRLVVLANKFDPTTNQITSFYREYDSNLPYVVLEDVDESGTLYFDVFHGTEEYDAYGAAQFDQTSGTLTIWPNTPCRDLAAADGKIYCLDNDKILEINTSSNTVRQWIDPGHRENSAAWSIDVDSVGTVFFIRDNNIVRLVPSTGTFTTFDIEVSGIQVDFSDTLHATQYGHSALTLQ